MDNYRAQKIAILGAGVMGAQIAAHFANAGFVVYLFDLVVDEQNPNSIALMALQRLKQLKPAPLGDVAVLQRIIACNYRDDLACLRECDLVIEAIAEKLDWKESLYLKILPHLGEHTILATNTSGLSINQLAKIMPANIAERFCGMHYFNPPRYMPLVELIPQAKTQASLLDFLETFLTTKLGKQVIRAKDTPNFIANRIGVFSILTVFYHMERLGLTFDEVDALTGVLIGRAKSATFRTLDVVGLDTMAHVITTMQENLPEDPWHAYFKNPTWLTQLIANNALGQKSGCGIYKKVGKTILVLDRKTGDYCETTATIDPAVHAIFSGDNKQDWLSQLAKSNHKQAQFLWSMFCDLFHYTAYHAGEIAQTVRDIDMAMRFGFGWAQGVFELWQAAGWQSTANLLNSAIDQGSTMANVALPAWVMQCHSVYHENTAYSPDVNSYLARSQLPVYQRQLFPVRVLDETKPASHILYENAGVKLWHLDNEKSIAILSFKSKKNTFNGEVLQGIVQAVQFAEQNCAGIVIWQDKGEHFSYGADLKYFGEQLATNPEKAHAIVKQFQDMCLTVRYARIPVVAALRGLVLGGGCELALHADVRVAAFETYMGLVEAGVGILPAGGGSKEFALKAYQHSQIDPMEKLKDYFKQIAMAELANSALEAKQRDFLLPSDIIVMHNDEILYVALQQAKAMSDIGYQPPVPVQFKVLGEMGIANFQSQLVNLREGGFISSHDYLVASKIAETLCGGHITPYSLVDEAWMLAQEREAFLALAKQEKTMQRIQHTLTTGKPLRN